MKRIMLDTSVYGKLSEDPEMTDIVLQKLAKDFVIYGTDVIKKELRETPRHIVHGRKKVRSTLLSLYHALVRKERHELQNNKLIETLLRDYLIEYRKRGGNTSERKLRNDMTIIATATIYKLDIVVSDDKSTMLSPLSVETYRAVNKAYGMPDPIFKMYDTFKEEILKEKNQERPL